MGSISRVGIGLLIPYALLFLLLWPITAPARQHKRKRSRRAPFDPCGRRGPAIGALSLTNFKPYRDKRRVHGSQCETPMYTQGKDLILRVRGYQKYDLLNHQIIAIHPEYNEKFLHIKKVVATLHNKYKFDSLIAIGCSAG